MNHKAASARQLVIDGDAPNMEIAMKMVKKGFCGHPVMHRRTSHRIVIKMTPSGLGEKLDILNSKKARVRKRNHRKKRRPKI